MAAYPSSIGLQFTITPINGPEIDLSDNGDVRSVDLSASLAYRIEITHPVINTTDRGTLITFYDTNKTSVNTITLAGETYDVLFENPYTVESLSATYFNVSTSLIGNKQ